MKQRIKTGLAALVLLLAISCTKENSGIKSLPATDKDLTEALSTDIDGVDGTHSIKIGNQIWETTNLDVSHYRNGDRIPEVRDAAKWAALTTGAWCWYDNKPRYGKLYNWYAVNDPRGLAPAGWHVPSDAEWTTLTTFLGGEAVAGGKMKETGTMHWEYPNTGATNSSGFSGLPGGYRDNVDGTFNDVGYDGIWWSSTEYGTYDVWFRFLGNLYGYNIGRGYYGKQGGFSVRCLRD